MRTAATIKLNDMAISTIQLGFVGESNHNKIVFDCEAVFSDNPSAIQSITVTPPVGDPYPVVSARVGNNVEWIVGASDVAVEGDGKVQLTFVENNEIIKSYEANTTIMVSSVQGQEPTAIADWITAANATLEEVDEAIPTGGTKGQVLAKASNADRDTEWVSYSGSYNDMSDKPQIEGVTLSGDVSLQDLGAAAAEDIPDVSGFYTKPASGIPASDLATGVIPDVSGFYSKPQTGIPATDIADGVIPDVSGFYTKPSTGIPASDLATGVIPDVSGYYTKPTEGIPDTDMSTGVRTSLGKADSAYQKPGTGIPAGDLASGVIPDVSGFYTKPAGGIPASDIADGVIPDPTEIIDDTAGDGATQLTWSADKIKEETDGLKEAIENVLVYQEGSGGDSVTLTNLENVTSFKTALTNEGFKNGTITDGVYEVKNSGGASQTSPYLLHTGSWGNKKWIAGFKYKITKLSQDLGDPSSIRIHLGASQYYDETPVWGEWIDFSKTVTLDMTRIRFAVRGFATVPPSDSFKVEIKDMYLYDATDVSAEMCAYIMEQQSANYQDGTVTYGGGEEGYFPDTSLAEEGKAADSKAVGDAIASVRANVKDFGVKGDGQTDDTDAINTLFARGGVFYFPAGTYKISGTITLPSESEMYGDGDQTIINMYSCDDLEAKTFRGNDKIYPYILVSQSDNTKLHDFKLIGNNSLQEKRHGAVCVLDSANCDIRNLTIYNVNYDSTQQGDASVSGYGICVNRSEFVTVEKCNVEQCGYECIGIVDDCDFCTVRDCFTKNGWRTCIQVHRGSCNTLIENNYMLQNHDKYDACFTVHGVTAQRIANLRVLNNTLECQQNGDQGQTYCAPAQIMSCTDAFVFIGNRVLGGKRAFYIANDSTNARIIGNDFNCNDTSDYGVTIASLKTIVIGNYLDNEASTPVNHISNSPTMVGNVGIGS